MNNPNSQHVKGINRNSFSSQLSRQKAYSPLRKQQQPQPQSFPFQNKTLKKLEADNLTILLSLISSKTKISRQKYEFIPLLNNMSSNKTCKVVKSQSNQYNIFIEGSLNNKFTKTAFSSAKCNDLQGINFKNQYLKQAERTAKMNCLGHTRNASSCSNLSSRRTMRKQVPEEFDMLSNRLWILGRSQQLIQSRPFSQGRNSSERGFRLIKM